MRPSLSLILDTDNRYRCKLFYGDQMIAKVNDGIEDVRIGYKGKRLIVEIDFTNVDILLQGEGDPEFSVTKIREIQQLRSPNQKAEPGSQVDEKKEKRNGRNHKDRRRSSGPSGTEPGSA